MVKEKKSTFFFLGKWQNCLCRVEFLLRAGKEKSVLFFLTQFDLILKKINKNLTNIHFPLLFDNSYLRDNKSYCSKSHCYPLCSNLKVRNCSKQKLYC